MNEFLSQNETADFLSKLADHSGGVGKLAAFCGVDESNLRKAIKGKLQPPQVLLDRLGIERAVIYVLPESLSSWYENHASRRDEGESPKHIGEVDGDAR